MSPGHGSEEELKLMLSLVRPQYFVPIHGEYRQLARHARIASRVSRNDDSPAGGERRRHPLRRRRAGGSRTRCRPGRVLIDGTRSGEVGDEVLRDRRHLSGDGLVVPVVEHRTAVRDARRDAGRDHAGLRGGRAHRGACSRRFPTLLAATLEAAGRRGTDRPRTHQGEDSRRSAAVLPETVWASGRWCCRS